MFGFAGKINCELPFEMFIDDYWVSFISEYKIGSVNSSVQLGTKP